MNLDLLMRVLNLTDAQLGRILDCSRQAAHDRHRGGTRLRPYDIKRILDALELPRDILEIGPADVLRWCAEHRVDVLVGDEPGGGSVRMSRFVGIAA